jgi:predicted esterase
MLQQGVPPNQADAAMILAHGRGSTAAEILTLIEYFDAPGFAYLAPQAVQNTWYPHTFLAPLAQNEPYLSSALSVLESVSAHLIDAGMPLEKIILLGFSQGACLSAEYVARNAQRYGGVVALSGGLIGPEGTARDYAGSLAGTPIFLGCSDVDFHIPKTRVHETTRVFQQMDADVTERLYPGMGHTVNEDEIEMIQQMMANLLEE